MSGLDKFETVVKRSGDMYDDMVKGNLQFAGIVTCRRCGRTERVDTAKALRYGWPTCHGETMSMDSPA